MAEIKNPADSFAKTIIVLVGLAGSGKSTFALKFMDHMRKQGDSSWVRVSQDLLKTRKKCETLAIESLEKGKSVLIDRTNLSEDQRRTWIDLARKYGAVVEAVNMDLDKDACYERCKVRLIHEGGVVGQGAGRVVGM